VGGQPWPRAGGRAPGVGERAPATAAAPRRGQIGATDHARRRHPLLEGATDLFLFVPWTKPNTMGHFGQIGPHAPFHFLNFIFYNFTQNISMLVQTTVLISVSVSKFEYLNC
jgi:hypothetical protein